MSIPKHEIICGIYKITSPTGRIYIGQSIDIYEAWRMRYINKRNRQCQPKLYNSLNKHGRENHKFEVIEICPKGHLDFYEIYYVWYFNTFNSPHGMNLTIGGGGNKGFRHTEATKKRISENSKGLQNCLGKKYSQEHIDKIRKSNTGKKRTKEFSEKLRNINLGKKHSEETKEKIRKIVNQPEYKKRMLSYKLGVKRSPETIEKIASKLRSIILDTQTGIFYFGLKSAAKTIGITHRYLGAQLRGYYPNYTSFIYV